MLWLLRSMQDGLFQFLALDMPGNILKLYSDFDAEFPARQNVRRGSAHGLPSRRSRCLCRRTVSAADGDRPLPARRADPGLAYPLSSSLQINILYRQARMAKCLQCNVWLKIFAENGTTRSKIYIRL